VFEAGLGLEVRDAWGVWSASQDGFYSGHPQLDPEAWCNHVLKGPTHNLLGAPTDTLIRRDLFHRRGGFNPYLLQLTDLECWHRLGAEAGVVKHRQRRPGNAAAALELGPLHTVTARSVGAVPTRRATSRRP
jgi:hypothetical protein